MTPTVLITGASSYLAHRLIPVASEFAQVLGVARVASSVVTPAIPVEFDLAESDQIHDLLKAYRPTAIIHAAAINPGDGENLMDAVNHLASAKLAQAAADEGIRFVMVSTESVHNGLGAPYADDATPDPINAYGQSKADGEMAVLACNPHALIVRTSLIYGLEKMDRGTRGFYDRLQSGQRLVLFDDVYRQPVWVDSLSYALCKLAFTHDQISGTMNLVGQERISRAAFGLLMLKYWGSEAESNVELSSGARLDGVPMDLSCTCERADQLGLPRPGVQEVLNLAAGDSGPG